MNRLMDGFGWLVGRQNIGQTVQTGELCGTRRQSGDLQLHLRTCCSTASAYQHRQRRRIKLLQSRRVQQKNTLAAGNGIFQMACH